MADGTKRSHPTFALNWKRYMSECCSNTSLHGFKFLGERNRSIFERLLWLLTLVICIFFCVINILEAYHKWQTSPVVVSFATTETPVWEIPFPAVTICPEVKTEKDIANYTDLVLKITRGEQLSDKQKKLLRYMSMVCSNDWPGNVDENDDNLTEDLYEFLFSVQPNVDHTVVECSWVGRDCTDQVRKWFTPIITPDGVCFTFNLMDRKDMFTDLAAQNYYRNRNVHHQRRSNWTWERGYSDKNDYDEMPRRTFMPGIHGGLQLTFWVESKNLDYLCTEAFQGYKVILHNPSQIPFTQDHYFRVGLNQALVAAVKPTIVKTSRQLAEYHPDSRECYFADEKRLMFFKSYDQFNCVHECLSNYTFRYCGCVSFEMPRLNSTPICGRLKRGCVTRAAGALFAVENNSSEPTDGSDFVEMCDCRQTCNSIHYETEISQTEWRWQQMESILSKNGSQKKMTDEYSKVQIFFRDLQFITSERNELYGLMDFLSSCGGLFGLFMGFSFISLVEIAYFVSVRLWCNYKKHGSHYWSGDAELLQLKIE
ncbi:pickpocket protein 28-like isoform X1 [Photinus pyralis]|uniref:pickpocket protein 28-like isoform X1 n=1 Tax=Photinus pyralis TaxID=7054 RepID=UPI001266E876|nr:pickpocket protein 28-like isoform X1 [Photinus pyralis]XP_031357500.1 pickpocket protein 28-like isoform X1 [Photinus pyralis]